MHSHLDIGKSTGIGNINTIILQDMLHVMASSLNDMNSPRRHGRVLINWKKIRVTPILGNAMLIYHLFAVKASFSYHKLIPKTLK